MIINRNAKENTIVRIGGTGTADGGLVPEYVDVTVLCKKCNHDHLSQNVCLEDGTCKCSNGTGKRIDRVPLKAWVGGMERHYEWISSDGKYFDKYGLSPDLREGQNAKPLPPSNKIGEWIVEIFLVLFFFGFFVVAAYLAIFSAIASLSNPTSLIIVVVCSLLAWGLAEGIRERYFAPRLLSYREKRQESKYNIMKSTGNAPFSY